ncbi:uncharacterized protein LOC113232247 [Hyposmocoma kahamanoa]|uniref:uncharacterized protein LOC113232247 n=1 Tax=Hyposmocoma kahamanoa TaxID=1477025 RepID=UPI000E6D921B|nr:uncharacterized protein LOC113232247 [Hyposmocoma kahamanoa]
MCLCFFCVIRCRKLDKGIKVKPDATYENLSNERQFPPNLESNYARPFDRIDEEPQYACTSQESPYSVPYNEKDINKLYARPTPKNQRQKPAQDLYSEVVPKRLRKNEVTYADIEFNSNKKKTNVKNDEPLYSEIQKEDNYANLNPKQNPRYDNVINGGRYVNANTSEYAEPAYCELGNVKR